MPRPIPQWARAHLSSLALLTLAALPAAAAVQGVVASPQGSPIEGAAVEHLASGERRTTDALGRFAFADAEPPAALRISHPRFQTAEVELPGPEAATFVLEPKQEVFDQILVSARREPAIGLEAVSVAATSLDPQELPAPPSSLVELIEETAGVAANGQGGRFQAYSIRGVAGQRVLTSIAGMRVVTERRAGATASFVDPLLMGGAEVVRGPASTYYGSGALGGVVQVFPRRFDALEAEAGYGSQGDATFARVGWGGQDWSLGLAARRAGDTETPGGELLPSGYEQYSATISREWRLASGATVELLALPAIGRDIGKPNSRFPARVTRYPEEDHLFLKAGYRHPRGWRLEVFAHPNELVTENLQAGERSLVDNDAFDVGLNAQREVWLESGWTVLGGVELFGRRGVEATERVTSLPGGETETLRTLDGREDEASLYASARRSVGRATVEGGGRLTWLEQGNRGAATTDDLAWSGFAGLTLPLPKGFELAANLGTGLRFPGLSERFFTGSTGRGDVVANQDLDPERSLSLDLGLRYYSTRLFTAAYLFRNEIDDYIERVEISPGVRSFDNLTAGTLEGLEVEGFFAWSERLRLTWNGQTVTGESDDGAALADVPADRLALGVRYDPGAWQAALRWEHRFEGDDPGPGEQPTPAAELLSASFAYRLGSDLTLRLFGDNLLDETYLPSADQLSVPAAGRSVGVAVAWSGSGRASSSP